MHGDGGGWITMKKDCGENSLVLDAMGKVRTGGGIASFNGVDATFKSQGKLSGSVTAKTFEVWVRLQSDFQGNVGIFRIQDTNGEFLRSKYAWA